MVDDGLITEERGAASIPARNRVYSCLGGDMAPQIDFSRKTPLLAGDIIVICSDGFWAPLGNEALVQGYPRGSVMADDAATDGHGGEARRRRRDNLSVDRRQLGGRLQRRPDHGDASKRRPCRSMPTPP